MGGCCENRINFDELNNCNIKIEAATENTDLN